MIFLKSQNKEFFRFKREYINMEDLWINRYGKTKFVRVIRGEKVNLNKLKRNFKHKRIPFMKV